MSEWTSMAVVVAILVLHAGFLLLAVTDLGHHLFTGAPGLGVFVIASVLTWVIWVRRVDVWWMRLAGALVLLTVSAVLYRVPLTERAGFWAAVRRVEPGMTREQVDHIMGDFLEGHPSGADQLFEAVGQTAYRRSDGPESPYDHLLVQYDGERVAQLWVAVD